MTFRKSAVDVPGTVQLFVTMTGANTLDSQLASISTVYFLRFEKEKFDITQIII